MKVMMPESVAPRSIRAAIALLLVFWVGGGFPVGNVLSANTAGSPYWNQAAFHGESAREGFNRCLLFVDAWLSRADPETGLIPRNLEGDWFWNAKDSAADNYPFMVLTTALLDSDRFAGTMRDMLETEIRLTSRVGAMPDTWDFATQAFREPQPDLDAVIFGASEYIKDGLLPLTEWLGPSPWADRMISILDAIWEHAPLESDYGRIPSEDPEVNGEMLQTLSRLFWMTGDPRYLDWAIRLGDYHLLGPAHPTDHFEQLRLRDHGCEIVSGLCELYATVAYARPEKQRQYRKPLYRMLDRVLEVGRNEHGLFYDRVNPRSGVVLDDWAADNWGYTFNGFYTVYLIDGHEPYREATRYALSQVPIHYRNYDWEEGSADGDADSIEGALNLHNREPMAPLAAWMDEQIRIMWAKQKESGIIEGWHGDGNFARTTLMYCLWKTRGVTVVPWREDLRLGAVEEGAFLYLYLAAEEPWEGKVIFDRPRHRDYMKLPLDWPRINQFQEWFTVSAERSYRVKPATGDALSVSGKSLQIGFPVKVSPDAPLMWVVREE
jgi:hypothetical protein